MKKYTGRYTTKTRAALKKYPIYCQISGEDSVEGNIYVCNGFFIWRMNRLEYGAVVQPVTCCDPGNWVIDSNGKRDDDTRNIAKLFADNVAALADAATMQCAPLEFQFGAKENAGCYYSREGDFVAFYNVKYLEPLAVAELRALRPNSAAAAYWDGEAYAVIMPIRETGKAVDAIKAYFTD